MSQSDQFVDRFVVLAQNKEKMTFHNDGFFFPLVSSWGTLEKEMAARSSILAWRIPGTEEPDGL